MVIQEMHWDIIWGLLRFFQNEKKCEEAILWL